MYYSHANVCHVYSTCLNVYCCKQRSVFYMYNSATAGQSSESLFVSVCLFSYPCMHVEGVKHTTPGNLYQPCEEVGGGGGERRGGGRCAFTSEVKMKNVPSLALAFSPPPPICN